MDFENLMLRERSSHRRVLFHLYEMSWMGELTETESRWVIAKDWTPGDGGREWLLMGRRDVFFLESWNCFKVDCGDDCITI